MNRAIIHQRYLVSTLALPFEHADILYETAIFVVDVTTHEPLDEEPVWFARWPSRDHAMSAHDRITQTLERLDVQTSERLDAQALGRLLDEVA